MYKFVIIAILFYVSYKEHVSNALEGCVCVCGGGSKDLQEILTTFRNDFHSNEIEKKSVSSTAEIVKFLTLSSDLMCNLNSFIDMPRFPLKVIFVLHFSR